MPIDILDQADDAAAAACSTLNPSAQPFFPQLDLGHALIDGAESALCDEALLMFQEDLVQDDADMLAEVGSWAARADDLQLQQGVVSPTN